MMLFQVAALFVRSFLERTWVDAGMPVVDANYLCAIVGFVVLGGLMCPVLHDGLPHLRRWFSAPPGWWRILVAAIVLGILLRLVFWFITYAAIAAGWQRHGFAGVVFIVIACPPALTSGLYLLVLVLLTPFVEETINRGFILESLSRYGPATAVIVSSILFAVLHRLGTIPVALLFGVVVALQARHWKLLWGPVVTHATFNLAAFVDRLCLALPWSMPPGDPAPVRAALFAAAALVSVAAALGLATRRRNGGTAPAP